MTYSFISVCQLRHTLSLWVHYKALASKKRQGYVLGKPKGTLQKSKFDKDIEKIKELLGYGLSMRKMAKVLGYTNHIALNTYIVKRDIENKLLN